MCWCIYLSVRCAGITLQVTKVTGGVLQTEAGLVSLCYPGPIQSQQVIVGEHLNAVVVPGNTE